jgi:peptide chain release factor 3
MNFLKRCTFAIISHPDAGKTTMTEKIIHQGKVIRQAGMVKSKQGNYAKSDWMELEKQRGISVSSSVISFDYLDRAMHLLDTPGHKDFSEDTYRTLTAVESALMMIDSAKGVEEQTRKLMKVCRMRDTPIVTFMNKFDRDAMDPFELIDNVEKICSIQCIPMNWPIGDGVEFKGIYDRKTKTIIKFNKNGKSYLDHDVINFNDMAHLKELNIFSEDDLNKLNEDLEMLEGLIPNLDSSEFLSGIQTPLFFGSALFSFGVKELVDHMAKFSPSPIKREVILPPYTAHAEKKFIEPEDKLFSGFVFKIQANMDKNHRDRIAFLRVCSGKFMRNQKIYHTRLKKELKVSSPVFFQAQDRSLAEEAFPGDIIGIHDNGKLQIGDTFTEGKDCKYTGIPSFAPEIFQQVTLKDPLKAKQLDKGLVQLSEEGTVQLFKRRTTNEKILGAVGILQFEVVKFRLENEYGVRGEFNSHFFQGIRWLKFKSELEKKSFEIDYANVILYDGKDRVCFGVKSEWDLKLAIEKNPEVEFFQNSDYTS